MYKQSIVLYNAWGWRLVPSLDTEDVIQFIMSNSLLEDVIQSIVPYNEWGWRLVPSLDTEDVIQFIMSNSLLADVVNDQLLIGKIIRPYPSPFLVSSPVAFKLLNVLVLNIAEKLLAGR